MGTPGIGGASVIELATGVCPAAHFCRNTVLKEGIVALVGIRLYIAPIVPQERHGAIPAVGGRVVNNHRTLVSDLGPKIALTGLGARAIQDRNRGIIGVDDLRLQDDLPYVVYNGGEQVCTIANPVTHRRAMDVHAVTLEDPFLSMQGKVVTIFARQHVRQQARTGPPLLNRSRWQIGDHHAFLTVFADIFEADMLPNHKRGRHIVQFLSDLFTHYLFGLATARADEFVSRRMIFDSFSGQMGWQRSPAIAMAL
jgi:hypothetical protein